MRLFFQLKSAKEDAIRVFLEFEKWSEWVPKLSIDKIVRKSEEQAVLDWSSPSGPMTVRQTMEISLSGDTFDFKHISASFPIKKSNMEWAMLPAPNEGTGTTLRITVEVELAMLVPKAMAYSQMKTHFALWAQALDARASGTAAPEEAPAPEEAKVTPSEPKKILQVFQAEKGLEMWLLGKRYLIKTMR